MYDLGGDKLVISEIRIKQIGQNYFSIELRINKEIFAEVYTEDYNLREVPGIKPTQTVVTNNELDFFFYAENIEVIEWAENK